MRGVVESWFGVGCWLLVARGGWGIGWGVAGRRCCFCGGGLLGCREKDPLSPVTRAILALIQALLPAMIGQGLNE